jgi:competence protein ComEC
MNRALTLVSLVALATACRGTAPGLVDTSVAANPHALVVRVLDVGQGDAAYITNGGSRVFIDGGPDRARFAQLLDSLGLYDDTVDAVVLSHQHYDHYNGLRELFRTSRHITVRYFFENQDPSTATSLAELRDSIAARVRKGSLIYRDTDDPCGDGRAVCTLTLRGGAMLHLMRPDPQRLTVNDRSAAVKLVGPDSAAFTMWFGGDAERSAIAWFMDDAGYEQDPGMHVNVLKGDHHGSCNGVTAAYLAAVRPDTAVLSIGARNDYGHMHDQAKAIYEAAHVPWYRTDQNGTITIYSPGLPNSGYRILMARSGTDRDGPSDRTASARGCRDN